MHHGIWMNLPSQMQTIGPNHPCKRGDSGGLTPTASVWPHPPIKHDYCLPSPRFAIRCASGSCSQSPTPNTTGAKADKFSKSSSGPQPFSLGKSSHLTPFGLQNLVIHTTGIFEWIKRSKESTLAHAVTCGNVHYVRPKTAAPCLARVSITFIRRLSAKNPAEPTTSATADQSYGQVRRCEEVRVAGRLCYVTRGGHQGTWAKQHNETLTHSTKHLPVSFRTVNATKQKGLCFIRPLEEDILANKSLQNHKTRLNHGFLWISFASAMSKYMFNADCILFK